MATKRTLDFLPKIFQSNTNKKFLAATLDQLVTDPEFQRIDGYIGRKFAPTYRTDDFYVNEINNDRKNYQLEPSVVVKSTTDTAELDFYSSYTDLVNKIAYYGGVTNNHDRLFKSEYYTYTGLFDLDKFVNFGQYYWLPNGPDPIVVGSAATSSQKTFTVSRDAANNNYTVTGQEGNNPEIVVARGGYYKFKVNQPGKKFYIQTEPGIAGTKKLALNISTRNVLGVINNGADVGTIEFTVPLSNSQDRFLKMPLVQNVDHAIEVSRATVIGTPLEYFVIDGSGSNLEGKTVIFLNDYSMTGIYRIKDNGSGGADFDLIREIFNNDRVNVRAGVEYGNREFYFNNSWTAVPSLTAQLDQLYYQDADDPLMFGPIRILETPVDPLDIDVSIVGRKNYTTVNGIKFTNGLVVKFDDTVLPTKYQNKTYIVEGVGSAISLVDFDLLVVPEPNVKVDTIPWEKALFDSSNLDQPYRGPAVPDYLTSNRSSLDLNAWARHNRWFHSDVIALSARVNGTIPLYDQAIRAQRPIIEIVPNIQLFNHGRVGKRPVEHIDSTTTDAFKFVQHQNTLLQNGVRLNEGDRIVFINDDDPLVRSQIYTVNYRIQNEPAYRTIFDGVGTGTIERGVPGLNGYVEIYGIDTKFTTELEIGSYLYDMNGEELGKVVGLMSDTNLGLVESKPFTLTDAQFQYRTPRIQLVIGNDDDVVSYNCVVATIGQNKGLTYWYDGDRWNLAQQKTKTNQSPLFDAYDQNNLSFGSYTGSSFKGTSIISYKSGTGAIDKVLGIALSYSYSTNNTVADIVFDNNFDNDTFTYVKDTKLVTEFINFGYLRQNLDISNYVERNIWEKVVEPTKQYQIFGGTYTGKTNHFEIDALPAPTAFVPNTKVFLNNNLLDSSQYSFRKVGKRNTVRVNANLLTVGDKVDILIYSQGAGSLGYYQIPINLDYNSKNASFAKLTLGQLRNHLTVTGQNTVSVVGSIPGSSNLRDLNIAGQGGNILQQSAPTIYASLFLIHSQANFINSLDYARREYTKFKNKFIELASSISDISFDDPKAAVDTILTTINAVKNNSFSWYHSDMVPYGDCDVTTYKIDNPGKYQYNLNSIFNDTVIQNRGVLVYLNGRQLIKDTDFKFDHDRPAVILSEDISLTTEDTLEIRDYTNTDANYIPETPTKLGLYPKFLPNVYRDTTYREPTLVIQGHDGSITPAYGDYRDDLLLELELRIYNNIKVSCSLDLEEFVPGRFRSVDYTRAEFNRVINPYFLKWVGINKLDYIKNSWFNSNDPFTYNFGFSKDSVAGENLPGYWRAIYQYFYDTDRPHTAPWEMLGFREKPTWWDRTYGPAPYTKDNTLLWYDLEKGIIAHGSRRGKHDIYARPGLSKILPVDSQGRLVDPLSAGIATQFNSVSVSDGFEIGDGGPVESAWKRTSDYPYAIQAAIALTRPAWYFGTRIDINGYKINKELGQYTVVNTNKRISPDTIAINGEIVNGQLTRSSGYINWIADYMTSLGLNAAVKLRTILDNLNVELTYRMAGYSDKNYLTVLAEQYSPNSNNTNVIVPNESYSLILNKNVPLERVAYSAVIIEKTANGFVVSGYNLNYPYFTLVPSDTAGGSYTITQDGRSAIIYKEFKRQKITIPYGYQFTSRQQVVDFLVSYQRYLMAQGFLFDDYDDILAQTRDWVLSTREFLSWTTQGWREGSVLVLSPINNKIKLLTTNSIVDEITNDSGGSKILDPSFTVIKNTNFTSIRNGNDFELETISGQTIAFAEFNLTQFEHILRFDNTTVFNDVIYQPETGSRQFRLKLVGSKTDNWTGELNPAGFIYNSPKVNAWRPGIDYLKGDIVSYKDQYYTAAQKIPAQTTFVLSYWKQIERSQIKTGLLSNFANNASKFIDVYDRDSSLLDYQMAKMSAGLIGFRERSYLTDFYINPTSQLKFYQGMIKEKGTKEAIDSLLGAKFGDIENKVQYFEEWGFRVGEYGALTSNQTVEFVLDQTKVKNNPTGLVLSSQPIEGMISVNNRQLWSAPLDGRAVRFLNRTANDSAENDLQTAGYVNIDDIDGTVFTSKDYNILSSSVKSVSSGYTVWVAKDHNKDWNVYRATEIDAIIQSLEYSLDRVGRVTTKDPHGLSVNQIVVIRNLDDNYNGFYIITSVINRRSFTVGLTEDQSKALKQNPVIGNGILFVLHSVRFDYPGSVSQFVPPHGWKDLDTVWIDQNQNNRWAVYQRDSRWHYVEPLSIKLGSYRENLNYGTSVRIDDRNRFVVVGAPGAIGSAGRLHIFDYFYGQKERAVLSGGITEIESLGACVDTAKNIVVAGAPESRSATGLVLVYLFAEEFYFEPTQVLRAPNTADGARYGYSMALSRDANRLYVGSPGTNQVFAYKLKPYTTKIKYYRVKETTESIELPENYFGIIDDPYSLAVYYRGNLLIPDEAYTVSGNTIFFVNPIVTEDFETIESEDGEFIFGSEFGAGGGRGSIVVKQRSYYEYVGEIQREDNSNFGWSVATGTTGEYFIAGAPTQTVDSVPLTGLAYLYKNDLTLINTIIADQQTYKQNFGYSVEMSNDQQNVYVGAPGYSVANYSGGLVYRFIRNGNEIIGTQTIKRPDNFSGENFGSVVKIDNSATVMTVSSTVGTIISEVNFDDNETTLDGNITKVVDITRGSGAVYMYNLFKNPDNAPDPYGNFVYAENFNAPTLQLGDKFGIGIDYNDNQLWIGAAFNDSQGLNAGQVYVYTNSTGAKSWNMIREQRPVVNINSINGVSLYSKTTGEFLTSVDYIDPLKGKCLGVVEQYIDYKTSRDPAIYNNGNADIDFYWSSDQVGKTWWNLDRVRFIDYEQDAQAYRLNNWGRLFPGSLVEVYQWIESDYRPSEYEDALQPGVPLHSDDSFYTTTTYVDADTGIIKTKYYFWVRGLTSIPEQTTRKLSVLAMENMIANPTAQNIPYVGILSDRSIGVFNCNGYLKGTDTILRIDYKTDLNNNLIYSEYELVPEGNSDAVFPRRAYNRLVDSISGKDANQYRVPDYRLKPSQILGLSVRPHQTLILNRHAALKNLSEYCNSVFAKNVVAYKLQNSLKFKNNYFFKSDPLPKSSEYDHVVENLTELNYVKALEGIRVLVKNDADHYNLWTIYKYTDGKYVLTKNQTFDTKKIWSYSDWYAAGFDPRTKPTYIVKQQKDLEKLSLKSGDVVKITNGSAGFEVYKFTSSTESDLVGIENGTIVLNENLWNIENNDVGFDSGGFESIEFDIDYSIEIRNLMNGLQETVFVDDLLEHRTKMMFVLVNYILSEQKQVDWVFKTSFISVLHQIKQLSQYPNYNKDNHTYYEEYINEVKPYRTKIRDYRLKYSGLDIAAVHATDFDIPAHWDEALKQYRSPNGQYLEKDSLLWAKPEYKDWAENFTNHVSTIVISDPGSNYTEPPIVRIIANDDTGDGAQASAVLNVNGGVQNILITNPGSGYRNTPTVIISGDGIGATAIAQLANNKVRSIKTVLRFDRTSYSTKFKEWLPGKSYTVGEQISYQGKGYQVTTAITGLTVFNPKYVKPIADNAYETANDRIAARYQPTPIQVQKDIDDEGNIDLRRLVPGSTYRDHRLDSRDDLRDDTILQTYPAYETEIVEEYFSTDLTGGSLVDPTHSYAPEELVPATMFDNLALTVVTEIGTGNVAYRISKDMNNNVAYQAISGLNSTALAQDLGYNDSKIFLTDISAMFVPNPSKRIPGYVYINGEKIGYYQIDSNDNSITQLYRGVGGTGTPLTHASGSKVYNASKDFNIPNSIVTIKDKYQFNKNDQQYAPAFNVLNNKEYVTGALKLFISVNQLVYEQDYTIELFDNVPGNSQARVSITFTDEAKARYTDGLMIFAEYTEHKIWLNPGDPVAGTVTDGTGLQGSTTDAANFIKGFSYF